MVTSSNGNIFRPIGHLREIHRSLLDFPSQSNRNAGDLRRQRADYDVTVNKQKPQISPQFELSLKSMMPSDILNSPMHKGSI